MARKKIWMVLCIMTALCAAGCSSGESASSGETASVETEVSDTEAENGEEQTDESITGRVTAVNGKEITLALVEMPERGEGGPGGGGEEPPERPEGEQPPSMPEGGKGGAPGGRNATGEEKTITVSEDTVYTLDEMGESKTASLEDIEEGNFLRVVMDGDTAASVTIMKMGQGGHGNGKMNGSSTGSISLKGVYTVDGTEETQEDADYTSSAEDENTVLVTNGGSLSLTGGTLAKSGDTSSDDESNFYGLNAVFTAAAGSTAVLECAEQ